MRRAWRRLFQTSASSLQKKASDQDPGISYVEKYVARDPARLEREGAGTTPRVFLRREISNLIASFGCGALASDFILDYFDEKPYLASSMRSLMSPLVLGGAIFTQLSRLNINPAVPNFEFPPPFLRTVGKGRALAVIFAVCQLHAAIRSSRLSDMRTTGPIIQSDVSGAVFGTRISAHVEGNAGNLASGFLLVPTVMELCFRQHLMRRCWQVAGGFAAFCISAISYAVVCGVNESLHKKSAGPADSNSKHDSFRNFIEFNRILTSLVEENRFDDAFQECEKHLSLNDFSKEWHKKKGTLQTPEEKKAFVLGVPIVWQDARGTQKRAVGSLSADERRVATAFFASEVAKYSAQNSIEEERLASYVPLVADGFLLSAAYVLSGGRLWAAAATHVFIKPPIHMSVDVSRN